MLLSLPFIVYISIILKIFIYFIFNWVDFIVKLVHFFPVISGSFVILKKVFDWSINIIDFVQDFLVILFELLYYVWILNWVWKIFEWVSSVIWSPSILNNWMVIKNVLLNNRVIESLKNEWMIHNVMNVVVDHESILVIKCLVSNRRSSYENIV